MKRLLGCCLLLSMLSLASCARPQAVVVEVRADSAGDMFSRLLLRLPEIEPIAISFASEGLWNELQLPPEKIAVLGFDVHPGDWRVPLDILAGNQPMRGDPLLPETTQKRVQRFFAHAEQNEAAIQANQNDRPLVLAAHTARGLATDLAARNRFTAIFVRFDTRAPGLDVYVADAVRDLALLAGPKGRVLIWLTDAEKSVAVVPSGVLSGEIDKQTILNWLAGN